jgi:hypothetical protein
LAGQQEPFMTGFIRLCLLGGDDLVEFDADGALGFGNYIVVSIGNT